MKKSLAEEILDKNGVLIAYGSETRNLVLRAMEEYAIKRLLQYKKNQEPNIKLVNHPYNKNDEFQG